MKSKKPINTLFDILMKCPPIRDEVLYEIYGENIHYFDLRDESVENGIIRKLMLARELGINYCVVVEGVVPMDREWNPLKGYITTKDIATKNGDREEERENAYLFLHGKNPKEKQESIEVINAMLKDKPTNPNTPTKKISK